VTTDQFSVNGRTAIVTGSSSGIGRAIVERFAADGANVVVTSRDQANVEPVAEAINERANEGKVGGGRSGGGDGDGGESSRGRAIAVECDVTDRAAVEALREATIEEFGSVDVLVNNAGASFVADFEEITPNGWKTIVDINLHGTYHCTQVIGEGMRERGGGRIINVASVAGQRGSKGMSPYGAAKAAVINFTTSLAANWAEEGIWANCIAPGLVATEGVRSQMGVKEGAETIDRAEADRRIGRPGEIADVTQFLASPASSYLNGETITVKGVPRLGE
jgi:3-oxoacyl-[acyl-carrier protein] reductase